MLHTLLSLLTDTIPLSQSPEALNILNATDPGGGAHGIHPFYEALRQWIVSV